MKLFIAVAVLSVSLCCVNSRESPPKVQVYSHKPGEFGSSNTLICHVSGFQPPDISIALLKNGVEIPNAQQSDLAFKDSWQFHLTMSAPFTPKENDQYSCAVNHLKKTKTYSWETDM